MVDKSNNEINYTYLIVKLTNGKFENWGAFTIKDISVAINDAINLPYVDGFVFSNNQYEADKRNRRYMFRIIKDKIINFKKIKFNNRIN